MEAASARFAARDRWGEMGAPAPSQLHRFIQAACSPENYEPNLALNLEIADLINAKKGSAPREAAVAIVSYINHRSGNVAMLALNLLDICVKNCGYPFHLQISTKEFLNELVRRFPERPPIRPSRVQLKILEAIEEWRGTICETSRYREDLGFIRDMHRLLSYKGYTFPEVRREDAAVLNPSDVRANPACETACGILTLAEPEIGRGDGGGRARGAVGQAAGAHPEGLARGPAGSKPADEGHGWIRYQVESRLPRQGR
jgi:hypothetical protein